MLEDLSFDALMVVAAVAFAAPLVLGLSPRLRLPSVVVEIILGVAIGPSVLGWIEVDLPLRILSVVGLGFLLFVSGMEVDLRRLRGPLLRLPAIGLVVSFVLGLGVGFGLHLAGAVRSPLLIAIALSASGLGLVVPVLKDSGHAGSPFGQTVIAGATVAEVGAVLLLTLFFSGESPNLSSTLILLGAFVALLITVGVSAARLGRSVKISAELVRLQDTTAQIRVRGAVLLLLAFVALAARFGLETILGAFMAGVMLAALDRDVMMTHPQFRQKLEGLAFGFLVPVFFVVSGLQLDLRAVFADAGSVALVPVFLAAMLLVRGVPALLYRPLFGGRRTGAAALLQATSLPFLVATAMIGADLELIGSATAAALVMAGLLSVLIFPLAALTLLGTDREALLEERGKAWTTGST